MSTYLTTVNVDNNGVTSIVDTNNAPNSPCEVIVQNNNGNGVTAYLGDRFMYEREIYGIRLLDGMAISVSLGSNDELYAFADDSIQLTVLKTSGSRR